MLLLSLVLIIYLSYRIYSTECLFLYKLINFNFEEYLKNLEELKKSLSDENDDHDDKNVDDIDENEGLEDKNDNKSLKVYLFF